jgi:hypothetical protein
MAALSHQLINNPNTVGRISVGLRESSAFSLYKSHLILDTDATVATVTPSSFDGGAHLKDREMVIAGEPNT